MHRRLSSWRAEHAARVPHAITRTRATQYDGEVVAFATTKHNQQPCGRRRSGLN